MKNELHTWERSSKSEPLKCTKCGSYYSDPKTPQVCSGRK